MTDPIKLLWIDLETTGPDPRQHTIIEVAALQTPFDQPFNPMLPAYQSVCFLWADDLEDMDPFCYDMHSKSGLLAECRSTITSLREAEHDLLELVPDVGDDKDAKTVLAGSSVHFGLAFIREHMPQLAQRLSHRVYDVSALALYCRSIGMPHVKSDPGHRALADVLDSMEYARTCHRWLKEHFGPNLHRDHTP